MNKTAAFFMIAMLTLAAACGAAQPPEDWNKMYVAFRSKGKLYVYAHENRPLSFGTFTREIVREIADEQQHSWIAGDNGNWTLEIPSFNKKLNKNQIMKLRFFQAPEDEAPNSIVFAEIKIDGQPVDFLIQSMIKTTAKRVIEKMQK